MLGPTLHACPPALSQGVLQFKFFFDVAVDFGSSNQGVLDYGLCQMTPIWV